MTVSLNTLKPFTCGLPSLSLALCVSVCLFLCLSIYFSLSLFLWVCVRVSLSLSLSGVGRSGAAVSQYLSRLAWQTDSGSPPLHLPAYISVCLPVCLPACVCVASQRRGECKARWCWWWWWWRRPPWTGALAFLPAGDTQTHRTNKGGRRRCDGAQCFTLLLLLCRHAQMLCSGSYRPKHG